jgi:mannose-6-phosphate isomerase
VGGAVELPRGHAGPQILLGTQGRVQVHSDAGELTLNKGAAAWIAAGEGPVRLLAEEPSTVFRATVGI